MHSTLHRRRKREADDASVRRVKMCDTRLVANITASWQPGSGLTNLTTIIHKGRNKGAVSLPGQ